MDVLIAVGIFAAGLVIGFGIAAVTETRLERKLDKKFWKMQDQLRELIGK